MLTADHRLAIVEALAPYRATLTSEDRIAKGDKTLSVQLDVKGGRLRMSQGSTLLASYPAKAVAKGVSDFVEKFWYWTES